MMKFVEDVVSWGTGSRKAQACVFGVLFVLFKDAPQQLGLNFTIEKWQALTIAGLFGVYVLGRALHDYGLAKNGKV
jgi:hypothetical protein